MSARVKLPTPLNELLRSELEAAIHESALHRDDDFIARRYIIDKWPQIDIAAELGWERSTVSHHMPHILVRGISDGRKNHKNHTYITHTPNWAATQLGVFFAKI